MGNSLGGGRGRYKSICVIEIEEKKKIKKIQNTYENLQLDPPMPLAGEREGLA